MFIAGFDEAENRARMGVGATQGRCAAALDHDQSQAHATAHRLGAV